MGAYPVFVLDGDPSPLKKQARVERFLRGSGVDSSAVAAEEGEETTSKNRNGLFARYVHECVELLELLGMPVLKANSEAEALCAQLNSEGHVDACITADSDAFLFGASCVIKSFKSNSKEPFECYYMSDVEAGVGLGRKQMVAIALLVGSDHDLGGVSGFGVDNAVRFVQLFTEEEILDRLSEIGKGVFPVLQDTIKSRMDLQIPSLHNNLTTPRFPHCSHCGHPGSKSAHLKSACEYCVVDGSKNCIEKPTDFKCKCPNCNMDRVFKEQKKQENWQIKVCKKIAEEHNFPNREIIDMYLCGNHGNHSENSDTAIRWNKPNLDNLADFLVYHQHWEPSYIRQRVLPMLSTIYLREIASSPNKSLLLHEQYEFHSILRVKIRYGHPYFLVKWKRAGPDSNIGIDDSSNEQSGTEESAQTVVRESTDLLDEPEIPQILIDDGCWYLLTDENMELVQAAFPKLVERFLEEKRIKELKSKQRKVSMTEPVDGESNAVQLSITQFYRSAKSSTQLKLGDNAEKSSVIEGQPKKNRKTSTDLDHTLPKSVRRRLLFD
ncbi:flap endonuclease GEN-like 1 [Asparagus officinalis]|nr:flap endonuclease GEN-like 1 [Asparagus officinalis]